jgi:hypothetical protein
MNFDLCVEVAKDVFGVGQNGGRRRLRYIARAGSLDPNTSNNQGESDIIVTFFY